MHDFIRPALALLITACGASRPPPLVITTMHPSSPTVETSGALEVREQSVLVVSAASIAQLAAQVMTTASGVAVTAAVDTTGYDLVTSAFESALLNAGARPVSQAALATAVADAQVQAAIQSTASQQGDAALVQQSIALGRATSAPLVLVIRSVYLGYAQDPSARLASLAPGCREWRVRAAELGIDAALVRVEDASVVWTGRALVRATDLLSEPVTLAAGPGHTSYERDYGPIRVVATGDTRSVCEGSDIPGYTCWEVESNDCSAGEGPGARPISEEAVQTLVSRAIAELLAPASAQQPSTPEE